MEDARGGEDISREKKQSRNGWFVLRVKAQPLVKGGEGKRIICTIYLISPFLIYTCLYSHLSSLMALPASPSIPCFLSFVIPMVTMHFTIVYMPIAANFLTDYCTDLDSPIYHLVFVPL